ncbi:MAG: zf-HC2 domain-containing protein [Acidobacteriota bacterium]
MNCVEAKELIQPYIDSELDCRDTLEVQRHLESCSSCAGQIASFIKLDESLRESARRERCETGHIRERILSDIRKEAVEPDKRKFIFHRAAAAAALVLIGLLVALWMLPGSSIGGKVYAAAIRDHAHHCSLESLTRMKVASDPAEIDRLVSEYSGLKKAPDLSGLGFADARAKVCPLDQTKTAHVVYQHPSEPPLSLFLWRHTNDLNTARLIAAARDGFTVASASESGVDVIVISSMDEKRTREIAETVIAQIRRQQ